MPSAAANSPSFHPTAFRKYVRARPKASRIFGTVSPFIRSPYSIEVAARPLFVTRGNRRPCLRCEILKSRNPCRPKVAGKNTLILQVGRPALGSRYRKKLETGMKQHLLKARDIAILRWQKASTDWIVCEGSALPTRGGRCRS